MSRSGAGLRHDRAREHWLEYQRTALAHVGADRLVLDDTTRYGLRRRHIICYGGLPDPDWWETALKDHPSAQAWQYMDDLGIGHLWIVWKEKL
jgi:hypothetical protein